jgi:hypothetical protein
MMKNQDNVNNAYDNLYQEKVTQGLKLKIAPKSKELTFADFIAEFSKKAKTPAAEGEKEKEEKPKSTRTKAKKEKEIEE